VAEEYRLRGLAERRAGISIAKDCRDGDAIRQLCLDAGMSEESTTLDYLKGVFYKLQQLQRAEGPSEAPAASEEWKRTFVLEWWDLLSARGFTGEAAADILKDLGLNKFLEERQVAGTRPSSTPAQTEEPT
jgi:hypothetical protein